MYEVLLAHAWKGQWPPVRKWLGYQKRLSSISRDEDGALSLPLSSLVEEFKSATVRLDVTLTDSQPPMV